MGLNNVDTDQSVGTQQQNINSIPVTQYKKFSKVLKENNSNINFSNFKQIFDLDQKPNDSNLGVVKTTMAPALTEPFRSANQLTLSPNSDPVSPRPHTTSNISSSKKNSNDCLIDFQMGPMSEPNTNTSLGTNDLENIDGNLPLELAPLENDLRDVISTEIFLKSGVVENCRDTVNRQSIELMDSSEPDHIHTNVQLQEPSNANEQSKNSPPSPTLSSQSKIGSEEKLIGFDLKEIPRVSQDSTITASEGNDVEGKFKKKNNFCFLN